MKRCRIFTGKVVPSFIAPQDDTRMSFFCLSACYCTGLSKALARAKPRGKTGWYSRAAARSSRATRRRALCRNSCSSAVVSASGRKGSSAESGEGFGLAARLDAITSRARGHRRWLGDEGDVAFSAGSAACASERSRKSRALGALVERFDIESYFDFSSK